MGIRKAIRGRPPYRGKMGQRLGDLCLEGWREGRKGKGGGHPLELHIERDLNFGAAKGGGLSLRTLENTFIGGVFKWDGGGSTHGGEKVPGVT